MAWTVETLGKTVDAELSELPPDMRAKFTRFAFLIESVGLERVGEPHVKHIEGALWEIGYYCPSRQKCNIGYSACMTRRIGKAL